MYIQNSFRKIIELSFDQIQSFAANCFEVENRDRTRHGTYIRRQQRTCRARFKENRKIRFVTVLDLNIYLNQIKLPISLHTCAPISELPSNISTTEQGKQCYDTEFFVFNSKAGFINYSVRPTSFHQNRGGF